jgi:hypothetical protein
MPAFGTCTKHFLEPQHGRHPGRKECRTHHNVYGTKPRNGELEQGHLFIPLRDVAFDKDSFPVAKGRM